VSIPSNIAEGYGRGSRDQYRYFLGIAQGSYLELQTQLLIASNLGFADSAEVTEVASQASEVGRMLAAILRKLNAPEP
jgi:four helix bundle protein